MTLNIIKNYLTKNRCYQQNKKRTAIGIQLHTIGTGQGTAQSVADYWNQPGVSACVHYIVDCDTPGKVLATLPEDVYAWADAGYGNRNLITFEICESDYAKYTGGASYQILDESKFQADIMRGYQTAVLLCADICRRYGWDPMTRLPSGLYLISSHDEGRQAGLSSAHVDPVHVWSHFGLTMAGFRKAVKEQLSDNQQTGQEEKTSGTLASDFIGLSEPQTAGKLLKIARPIADQYDLFPSVLAAQSILESGYCTTELARKGNNVCGMKSDLLNSTWVSPTWDGKSSVRIRTAEQDAAGNTYYIYDDFRAYASIEDCMADRCAFFLNAKVGGKVKYDGIKDCRNYREQIQLIKDRGYATDVAYVDKVCRIIEQYNLNRYDKAEEADMTEKWYRVRKTWTDEKSQKGAFKDLAKAKECADQNESYAVFDWNGAQVYPEKKQTAPEKAVEWAKQIAADNSHGYDNREGHRWGPDYACSSLIIQAYEQAGIKVRTAGATKTANMRGIFLKNGFQDITAKIDLKTGKGLQIGDVLLTPGKHTEMYAGNGQLVGARGNANSGKAENGKQGDQTGQEIALANYYNFPWKYVLRYTGASGSAAKPAASYIVQAGVFTNKTYANNLMKKIKSKGLPAIVKQTAGKFVVQCGVFSEKKNTEALVKRLEENGFSAIIK